VRALQVASNACCPTAASSAEAGQRFADLALAAGYFDQAHLSRDVPELSGQAPRQLLAAQGEVSAHFTSAERLADLFGS
jgi:methylphosphotriester-DNA--protein-cysteine methyltransferase